MPTSCMMVLLIVVKCRLQERQERLSVPGQGVGGGQEWDTIWDLGDVRSGMASSEMRHLLTRILLQVLHLVGLYLVWLQLCSASSAARVITTLHLQVSGCNRVQYSVLEYSRPF